MPKDLRDRRRYKREYYKAHRDRILTAEQRRQLLDPEKFKDRRLRRLYGISISDFNAMFKRQSGVCAICGSDKAFKGRSLSVDHCHMTGKIRGILCGHCNAGLGHFKDSVDALRKAIHYLLQTA